MSALQEARPLAAAITTISFPCSEGGFIANGHPFVSSDGQAWSPLPFPVSVGGSGSGSRVTAALTTEDGILLVGQSQQHAACWFAVAPQQSRGRMIDP